jgi:hypothetical protein
METSDSLQVKTESDDNENTSPPITMKQSNNGFVQRYKNVNESITIDTAM